MPEASALSSARLRQLLGIAAFSPAVLSGKAVIGALIALGQGARYDNPNYQWFAQQYQTFAYIDRILVSPAHRGWGIESILYSELEAWARQEGINTLCCDVNVERRSDLALAHHRRHGFNPVGRRICGDKSVMMLSRHWVQGS